MGKPNDLQLNTPDQPDSAGSDKSQPQDLTAQQALRPPVQRPNKTKLLYAGLAIVLIFAAGTAWLLANKEPVAAPPSATVQKPPQTAQNLSDSPYNIIYSTTQKTGKTPRNCAELEQTKLFIKPSLSAAEAADNINLSPGTYVSGHDILGSKVALATDLSCGSTGAQSIWYSKDAGKSYTKVYTGTAAPAGSGDSITSMKFASDGNSLLIGTMAAGSGKNTVKEINLAANKVSTITTVNKPGVFIYGYDVKNQIMYYSQGCFACDGQSPDPVYAYDITRKTNSTLYKNPTGMSVGIAFNNDFTKFLYESGAPGPYLGAGAPYAISEIDVHTKQSKQVAAVSNDFSDIGYRTDDNAAYYTDGSNVYQFADGQSSLAFKSSSAIQDILTYSKDKAVATVANGYDTYEYDIPSRSEVKQLHVDTIGQAIGAAWN